MTIQPQAQRTFATEVVEKLRRAGHQAWWAGGCVRDLLLGRTPTDFDVATSARPEQVREVFGRRKTLAVGAAFGVIMVRGPRAAGNVEVATFRQDAAYSDGRHPDSVTFSDAVHDAQRRDFTINGMFYDPLEEEVHDYVDGRDDLERKVIRAIGDPWQRIDEDKLRMLRAVRFAATFQFELDGQTLEAIRQLAPQVQIVSAERVQAELRKMLTHRHRRLAMELLRDSGLLAVILPELVPLTQRPAPAGAEADNQWDFTLRVLARLEAPEFDTALAVLLHACAPAEAEAAAEAGRAIGERLKMPNKEIDRACWLIEHQQSLRAARNTAWPALQRLLIHPEIHQLVAQEAAMLAELRAPVGDLEFCRQRLQQPPDELNPPLLLDGADLIEHGVPRGPIYKRLLDAVRDAQLEGRVRDKAAALELVDRLVCKWT